MARTTSVEAYKAIRDDGLLSKRRFEVYDYLFFNGPLTAAEIWYRRFRDEGTQIDSVRPRMAELKRRGVVKEVGERPCQITGSTAVVWDVTERLPVEPEIPDTIPCHHCRGKGKVRNPQMSLFGRSHA